VLLILYATNNFHVVSRDLSHKILATPLVLIIFAFILQHYYHSSDDVYWRGGRESTSCA